MSIDLIAFGPHPDDVEIGMGGTIARHTAAGYTVGLCDLTAGEMGSNGTPAERRVEGEAAARVLGAAWRQCLGWPDGDLRATPALIRSGVEFLRAHRPRAVAVPYWDDRHPDHRHASQTLTEILFKSGLRRFEAAGDAWRPESIAYYFINDQTTPSFVIDVSSTHDCKRRALDCFRTQFTP